MFRHTVFWCKWGENNSSIKIAELEVTQVDLNREGHKEGTFILASQGKQVFYFTDHDDKKWYTILLTKQNITTYGNVENDTDDNIDKVPSFSLGLTRGDNIDEFSLLFAINKRG